MQELCFYLLSSIHWDGDYMALQWWVGMALCLLYTVTRNIDVPAVAKAAFIYFALHPLGLLMFKPYNYAPIEIQTAITITSLYSLCAIVLTTLFIFTSKRLKEFWAMIPIITAINATIVVANFITGNRLLGNKGFHGFLDYSGMNATLLAATFPTLIRFWDERGFFYYSIITTLIAIIVSKSSIPYGVLAISISSYLVFHKRIAVAKMPLFCATFASIALGFLVEGDRLFNSAGRFYAYSVWFSEWLERGSWVFGTGLGTFQVMAPMMQAKHDFMMTWGGEGNVWLWAHSDWLQVLFETGIIGLILSVWLFVTCVGEFRKRSDKISQEGFSVFMALSAGAVFNYPLRYFLTAFILVLSVAVALNREGFGGDERFVNPRFNKVV